MATYIHVYSHNINFNDNAIDFTQCNAVQLHPRYSYVCIVNVFIHKLPYILAITTCSYRNANTEWSLLTESWNLICCVTLYIIAKKAVNNMITWWCTEINSHKSES